MTHDIIKAITDRRLAAKLTQAQAAKMAGLSVKTYQRIESGASDIKLRNYAALIRGLNITDLDICLDCLGFSKVTPYDVAAAARVLPQEARTALVSLIMIMYRNADDI